MTEDDFRRCMNVMMGFTSEGLTRLQEAEKWAVDDPAKEADLPRIRAMIEDGFIDCSCDECGSWDGLDRRCSCGDRRVYWEWTGTCFAPICY